MNEFIVIKVMNESMMGLLKAKNQNYEKNTKIKEYLKDETIFFKINKENAYEILQNVGVKQEKLEKVYQKLISPDVFYNLLNEGKINPDDEKLVVKYKKYRL